MLCAQRYPAVIQKTCGRIFKSICFQAIIFIVGSYYFVLQVNAANAVLRSDPYQARKAKNIATGNRLAIAKDLLSYAKEYINSGEFKKAYGQERISAKPVQPVLKPVRTKSQIQQEEIAKTEKSLKEMEKSMASYDADMRKNMQPVLETFKGLLKEYIDPQNPYFESLLMYDSAERAQAIKRYEEDVKRWQVNYPQSFAPIIKARLQKMLDLTKNVDYSADLKTEYYKQKFVNQVYEKKPVEWKQVFRAGKEITEYARSFAQQWLSELGEW